MDSSAAPRREAQEDVERRILSATAHLIAEQGLGKLTIGAVCARSGYARAVVFQHFGDKESLAQKLVSYATDEFAVLYAEAVAARSGSATATPMDMLRALVDSIFELLTDMPVLFHAFLALWGDSGADSSPVRPALTEVDRRFRFAIAQTVVAGVSDGSLIGVTDPDSYASALLGQLRGISLQFVIDPTGVDLRGVRAEIERGLDRLAVRD